MREKLGEAEGERRTFTGTFVRVGSKPGLSYGPEPTFLLSNVRDGEGNFITDHLWLNQTAGFKSLGYLDKGDVIQFDGRVTEYGKDLRFDDDGHCRYHRVDYGITRPTKFKIVRKTKNT